MATTTALNAPAKPAEADSAGDLRRILATLAESWRLILLAVILASAYGIYAAWVTPNGYRAEAMVEIEGKSSGYAINEFSSNIDSLGGRDLIEVNKQIIQTTQMMERALDEGEFEVSIEALRAPYIGEALARNQPAGKLASAPPLAKLLIPNQSRYAWGGEIITVDSFTAPTNQLGRPFRIVAGTEGNYSLLQNGKLLGEGVVGKLLDLSQTADQPFRLMISTLTAHPGSSFTLTRISRDAAVAKLRGNLRFSEKALNTGLLLISGMGETPELAASRANAIARAFVRTNLERLSEEADKRLIFLSEQLPKLKQELEQSESALANYKANSQSSALSAQSGGLVSAITTTESQLTDLELQRAELASVFTPAHPSIISLDRRIAELKEKRSDLNRKVTGLPVEEARLVQYTRNATVSDALYTLLLNKAQELKIAKAGTVGTAHIVDDARPNPKPVAPNRFNLSMRYVLAGLILSIAFVLGRRQLSGTVERADDLEQRLGVAPHASIPYSKDQSDLEKAIKAGTLVSTKLLCHTHPNDQAVESFRSLRTSAYFALMEKQSNVIAITGAMPGVGKTFASVNLAGVFADTGRRTLVIDCDLRKGRLHTSFGSKSRSPGLSDLLVDEATQEQAIRSTYQKDLFVLTSGKLPPNPSELLGSQRFGEMLTKLKKEYDFIILDCPPVMNLADAVLVTQHAGAVYMIVRAKQTTFTELKASLQRLRHAGVTANGFVFNGFTVDLASYLRGGPDYSYYRSSDKHYNRENAKT